MLPRAAKEPALAIWQSCGVPGLKKLLRMNLLQDQGIKANRCIYIYADQDLQKLFYLPCN
jgi:hypothetical protein